MDFKSTNEKPLGKAGKAIEKDFTSQLGKGNVNLTEINSVLTEKEQSFKKKVWDLSKMESLVFSDPKLNAKYNEMSEDGQEKYGYHYNETIMNMLFNEYVTNDAGYRQKYLNAIPAEKERRDKSGINQLQQKGKEKMQKNSAAPKARTEGDAPTHNNSLTGVIEEDGIMDNNLNTDGSGTFDDREYLTHRINKKYDTMNNTNEDIKGGITKQHDNFSNSDASITQANKMAMNDTDPLKVGDYDKKNKKYNTVSINVDDEYVENQYEYEIKETTGAASSGAFSTALGAKNNVYENKSLGAFTSSKDNKPKNIVDEDCGCDNCEDCEEQLDETTTSASSGAYEGPFRKKSKDNVTNKPAWKGGEIIGENYIVNTNMFKDIYNSLNEGMDSPNDMSRVPMAEFDMTDNKQMQQHQLKNAYQQMDTLLKRIPTDPNAKKAYDNIKNVAQNISKQLGQKFNDPEKRGMFSKLKRGFGIGEGELREDGIGDVRGSMDNLLGGINSKEEKIKKIIQKGKNKFGDVQMLSHLPNIDIDRIFQQVMRNQTAINPMGEADDLNEKAKSKKQQQFMGMVHAAQKGELENPSASVEKVAKEMKPDDVEDFASTKHKGLPVKRVDEGIVSGTEDSIIGDNPTTMVNTMKDVQGSSGDINMGMNENGPEFDLNNHGRKDDVSFDNNNDFAEVGTSHGGLTGFNNRSDGYYPEYKKPEKTGAPKNKDLGKYNSITVKEQVCENCGSQLDEEGQCRRDEKPVAGKLAGEKGACEKKNKKSKNSKASDNKFNVEFRNKKEKERENKIEKKHTDYKKELEQNKKHMKKLKEMVGGIETLKEDKRPSALVQMDRLHKDNSKNFKADVKNSNSAELATEQDELTAKEQIEEVSENPYELAEKIEKDKMKQHGFNALKNDGNSTNDTNKDIPKRNSTDEEADDIMLNRGLGMQDIVYDNKPDERFEERMKKDMGETIYDQRQEKMKFRANAPMYNKDTMPVEEDTVQKTQFDKNISKFNNPKGIKENHIVAGKFINVMNKTEFISFNVNETPIKLKPEGTKLIVEGMGNLYTQKVNENVEMRNMMNSFDFYINGGKVSKVAKGKQTICEGNKKPQINEHVQKMIKLAGYKPSDYVDTSATRKNAKFKFTGNL